MGKKIKKQRQCCQYNLNAQQLSRFLVQIDGSNIEDTELRERWQLIDLDPFEQLSCFGKR